MPRTNRSRRRAPPLPPRLWRRGKSRSPRQSPGRLPDNAGSASCLLPGVTTVRGPVRQRYGSKVPSPRPHPPPRAGTGPVGPDDHERYAGPVSGTALRVSDMRTPRSEREGVPAFWPRIQIIRDADLALGRHDALTAELDQLVAVHPLRERLHAQLMLALYRGGRQADALAAYRRARALLVDELGIDPGEPLERLHAAVLAHDRALDWTGTPAPPGAPAPGAVWPG